MCFKSEIRVVCAKESGLNCTVALSEGKVVLGEDASCEKELRLEKDLRYYLRQKIIFVDSGGNSTSISVYLQAEELKVYTFQ